MDNSNAKHWSETWQTKKTTSFGDLFPNNYDGTFLEFWKNIVTDDLTNIVDLACGNGALSWIMNDIVTQRGMPTQVTGVDYAEIDPFGILEKDPKDYPSLTFIGNTPIEKLPFEDNSVGCFVSQYGIEYSDLTKTIPELGRALNESGKMAFIMHDIESEVLKGALRGLLPCKLAHERFRLHEQFMHLSELYDSEKKLNRLQGSKLIQEGAKRIEQSIQQIGSFCKAPSDAESFFIYLKTINDSFNNSRLNKEDRDRIISTATEQNIDYMNRILDLEAAAINQERRDELRELVQAQGFNISLDEKFHYDNHGIFGLAFVAERK